MHTGILIVLGLHASAILIGLAKHYFEARAGQSTLASKALLALNVAGAIVAALAGVVG